MAVAHQRPMDLGRLDLIPSKARRPQVFVDADLERPGLLPVETRRVRRHQRWKGGDRGRHGHGFSRNTVGFVHGVRFRSVRAGDMAFQSGAT